MSNPNDNPLYRRWGPSIGGDFMAGVAMNEWFVDAGMDLNNATFEAVHTFGSCAVMFGLARHAAIGRTKPKFVDIGTQRGISTRVLLTVAAMTDGHVYSYDVDPGCGEGDLLRWVMERGLQKRWTFVGKPSQEVEPESDIDFLSVDGDHRYEAVCSDMARHGAAVRDGGVLILDDYHLSHPGKVRWLHERWLDLAPLTIGPWAVLHKRPGDNEIYQRNIPANPDGTWTWNL